MKLFSGTWLKSFCCALVLAWAALPMQASEPCYFSLTETGKLNAKAANAVSLSLLSRYFKPLQDVPMGGLSSKACVYSGKVAEEKGRMVVMISGADLNLYGVSRNQGFDGYEAAFLDALTKGFPEKKEEICSVYPCVKPKPAGQLREDQPIAATSEPSREQQILELVDLEPFKGEPEVSGVIAEILKKLTQELFAKTPSYGKRLRLDYVPCVNEKGKQTEATTQITDQLMNIVNFYYTANEPMEPETRQLKGFNWEKKLAAQWRESLAKSSVKKKPQALLVCKVAPHTGSIMEKDLASLKVFFANSGNLAQASGEWFRF